jgi:hypothetical protein
MVRLKLFVRPDMLEDPGISSFPDASKLLSRKASLAWRRADLYALLYQCLGNAPQGGEAFRSHCDSAFGLKWKLNAESDAWVVPNALRLDEEKQKDVFHAITGPTMGSGPSGHKRGYPYTWLPNHLLDGREQVSPRSFAAALRYAAAADIPEDWQYALSYRGIQAGVQEASRIRVDEIREDYPWVDDVMKPLHGKLTVPCSEEEMVSTWKPDDTIGSLREQVSGSPTVKLPPQHIDDGPRGILRDLAALGVVMLMSDGRIQMPDVYRVAFGLGRRGGVRPLK